MVRPILAAGLAGLLVPAAAPAQQFIAGLVRDSAGAPLARVVVSIRGPGDTTIARATTERDGAFILTVPRPGRHQLRFDVAVDVVALSDTIAVEPDGFVERQFRLAVPPDPVYFEFQVTKPVVMAPGTMGPGYPRDLRDAHVSGKVVAQFVVDTTGRVRPGTFTVLRASAPKFADAVAAAVPTMKFLAAERDGRKVPQLVQQPFEFEVSR